jgi:hypothetical protein
MRNDESAEDKEYRDSEIAVSQRDDGNVRHPVDQRGDVPSFVGVEKHDRHRRNAAKNINRHKPVGACNRP